MDGRDIGTVVFPRAHVKLFITADVKIRAERRFHELRQKKIKVSREEVFDNLKHRDTIDSTREDSPIRMAEDAILIDNTNLSRKQQLAKVLEIIRNYQDEEI
jgi:cytidylate kinase